jgi:Putative adhesin
MSMMRSHLLLAVALVAGTTAPANAQRTSDTRFTPALKSGQRLSVSNIDGNVTVTQGRGQSAEIVAHKIVHKGNGDLVKAVLEETSNGYRVCTVYLHDTKDDSGCNRKNNSHDGWRERDPLDVDMQYDIKLPAGVAITVNTVDGSIDARGLDTPATLRSVDGDITFDGVAPESLNTVDGKIVGTVTNSDWTHAMTVRTVDGRIELTLPAAISMKVSGHTVDGKIDSDFPVTISGKWGPQSFRGEVGGGRGPTVELSSVDGDIRLRSSDGVRRGETKSEPARRRGRP